MSVSVRVEVYFKYKGKRAFSYRKREKTVYCKCRFYHLHPEVSIRFPTKSRFKEIDHSTFHRYTGESWPIYWPRFIPKFSHIDDVVWEAISRGIRSKFERKQKIAGNIAALYTLSGVTADRFGKHKMKISRLSDEDVNRNKFRHRRPDEDRVPPPNYGPLEGFQTKFAHRHNT